MIIRIHLKTVISVFVACMVLILYFCASEHKQIQVIKSDDPRIQVPIIIYHEIKPNQNGQMAISTYRFESDLKFLQQNNYSTITMTELINYVYNDVPLPPNPIILSFDDGYLNNYVYAFPLLKKYKMKAVISIIGKSIDDFTRLPSDDINTAHLTWQQLAEMKNSGCFEIQNHSYNLHTVTRNRYGSSMKRSETLENYTKILTQDLESCQQAIYNHLSVIPNTFTYPYGNISSDSIPIIKSLGFQASLSCKYGINLIGHDPNSLYCLMRINRYPIATLSKTLAEAEKTLKYRK